MCANESCDFVIQNAPLTEYENVLDGTLGDGRTGPVSFKLKKGAKSFLGMPYPVPKINKTN